MKRAIVALSARRIGLITAALAQPPEGLVKNPRFLEHSADHKSPAHYTLTGDAAWSYCGWGNEFSDWGVALHSDKPSGSVSQGVTGFEGGVGKWYRFSVRGLAEKNFAVADGGLYLKVDFFGSKGANSLDGVTREIDGLVAHDRDGAGRQRPSKTRRRGGLENLRLRVPPAVRRRSTSSA